MTATRPVDVKEAYFSWLYTQLFAVQDLKSPYSYTMTCRAMHNVIFQNLVPHDANRIAEAAELRNEFKRRIRPVALDLADIMAPDASVFEVLIALAKRADFMVALGVPTWFQIFMENLKLDGYNDLHFLQHTTAPVLRAIAVFNERRYKPNGRGGIFPLERPRQDQREVELWYQMGAYMTEKGMY